MEFGHLRQPGDPRAQPWDLKVVIEVSKNTCTGYHCMEAVELLITNLNCFQVSLHVLNFIVIGRNLSESNQSVLSFLSFTVMRTVCIYIM